jgi:ATP-dependent Clp protease protease subunit
VIGDTVWPPTGPDDWMAARLFAQRIVTLSGPLDHDAANHVAAQLMTLDALGDEPIELRLTAAEGEVSAALSLVDVIDLLGVPVHAQAVGRVHGPALAVLAVCDDRTVAGHASLRMVGPRVELWGNADQLEQQATAHQAEWAAFCACVARATGKAPEQVAADAETGRYFTAEEAVDYGLADQVSGPGASIHRLPGRPIGFRPDPVD